MSVQSARDFIKRIETDEDLKEQLEAAPDHETRRQIVQSAGFDFTEDEFKQMVDELAAAASQELTEEELQEVAGGRIGWCPLHATKCSPQDYHKK
jgi:predicted ribosomally synthesized peptide with nif11-like leader